MPVTTQSMNRTSTTSVVPMRDRNRIAALVNEYWPGSHADLIVTKLCDGYEVMWTPVRPHIDVVSVYVHDPGPTDVGGERAQSRGMGLYPTMEQALRCGGSRIGVGGAVVIGERNPKSMLTVSHDERGRPVDPRFDLFMEIARICDADGQAIPVFIDKYLGRTWQECVQVYDTARRLGMPLMAGSSVPVTLRPATQVPLGAEVDEVVAVASGIGEAPIFHPLELVQSMIERRRGHETGVASVQFLSGAAFWSAWRSQERWSTKLRDAALAAVPHFDEPAEDYYARRRRAEPDAKTTSPPVSSPPGGAEEAVVVDYVDGTRVSILMLTGYLLRRAVAIQLRGEDSPLVTWTPTGVKLTPEAMGEVKASAPGQAKPPTWNFDHLAFFVDEFLQTGVAPFPIERTLLTSGVLDAAMISRFRGNSPVETPHLRIEYHPNTL
jgi:hypothetical protein